MGEKSQESRRLPEARNDGGLPLPDEFNPSQPSAFPGGVSQIRGVPQRMYLSHEVPVRNEGWVDPDYTPPLSPWRRTVHRVRYALHRLRNFRILEILVILLILGGLVYFLSSDPNGGMKRRGSTLLR
jgi:hypothetical protein